jgi:cytochrome c-type biogenesis protein CcmE
VDPARKRKIRLVVALSAAVLLAAGLVYTSFSASTEAKEPSQLLQADPGGTYELTGMVVPGSVRHAGDQLDFRISDRDGSHPIPVTYSGTVPDPFREGREVIVTGKLDQGVFVAEHDSLITKCPSKFSDEAEKDPEHVTITQ